MLSGLFLEGQNLKAVTTKANKAILILYDFGSSAFGKDLLCNGDRFDPVVGKRSPGEGKGWTT